MRHIAFVLDPDGYWVEVIGQKPLEETENVKDTDTGSYRMVILAPVAILCHADNHRTTQ
jgi:hypothetical protein